MIKIWITDDYATLTGGVTMTKDSTAVTGSGTDFQNELQAGDIIRLQTEDTYWGFVKSIESATALTLESNYLGDTGTDDGEKKTAYPFELTLSTISTPEFTENRQRIKTRKGVEYLLEDPTQIHPASSTLSIHPSELDTASTMQKDSVDVYLATYLYWAFTHKETIEIFSKPSAGANRKAQKGQLLSYDPELAGHTTEDEKQKTYIPIVGGHEGRMFIFDLWIEADGHFTDWDDLTTGSYLDRHA